MTILSRVSMDIDGELTNDEFIFFKDAVKRQLKGNMTDFKGENNIIEFDIHGVNEVDYGPLFEMCKQLGKQHIKFGVNAIEFISSDETAFEFDSEIIGGDWDGFGEKDGEYWSLED